MTTLDVEQQPVTVTIRRRVRPGAERAFESALKEFIPSSLGYPGHLGVHVHAPDAEQGGQYIVVLKFSSRKAWRSFQSWPDYVRWRGALRGLLEDDPQVEESCGLESWFKLPGERCMQSLPRYKMALVTWLGVFPTTMLLAPTVGPYLEPLPFAARHMLFGAMIVAALTWVVMPVLTRLLRSWLHPELRIVQISRSGRTDANIRSG